MKTKQKIDYRPFCNLYKGDYVYGLKLNCCGNLSDTIHFGLHQLVKDISLKKYFVTDRIDSKDYVKLKIECYHYYMSFKKETNVCKRYIDISIHPIFSDKNAAIDYILGYMEKLKNQYKKMLIQGSFYSKGHKVSYIQYMPLIYNKIKTL